MRRRHRSQCSKPDASDATIHGDGPNHLADVYSSSDSRVGLEAEVILSRVDAKYGETVVHDNGVTSEDTVSTANPESIETLLYPDKIKFQEAAETTSDTLVLSDTGIMKNEIFLPCAETSQEEALFHHSNVFDMVTSNQTVLTSSSKGVCKKCGWAFTNHNPSPKVRRSHERRCSMTDSRNEKKGAVTPNHPTACDPISSIGNGGVNASVGGLCENVQARSFHSAVASTSTISFENQEAALCMDVVVSHEELFSANLTRREYFLICDGARTQETLADAANIQEVTGLDNPTLTKYQKLQEDDPHHPVVFCSLGSEDPRHSATIVDEVNLHTADAANCEIPVHHDSVASQEVLSTTDAAKYETLILQDNVTCHGALSTADAPNDMETLVHQDSDTWQEALSTDVLASHEENLFTSNLATKEIFLSDRAYNLDTLADVANNLGQAVVHYDSVTSRETVSTTVAESIETLMHFDIVANQETLSTTDATDKTLHFDTIAVQLENFPSDARASDTVLHLDTGIVKDEICHPPAETVQDAALSHYPITFDMMSLNLTGPLRYIIATDLSTKVPLLMAGVINHEENLFAANLVETLSCTNTSSVENQEAALLMDGVTSQNEIPFTPNLKEILADAANSQEVTLRHAISHEERPFTTNPKNIFANSNEVTLPHDPASTKFEEETCNYPSVCHAKSNALAASIDPSSRSTQICKKCDYLYPNPHPSGKLRRRHLKNCSKPDASKVSEDPHHSATIVAEVLCCDVLPDPHHSATIVDEMTLSAADAANGETLVHHNRVASPEALSRVNAAIDEALVHHDSVAIHEMLSTAYADAVNGEIRAHLHHYSITVQEAFFKDVVTSQEDNLFTSNLARKEVFYLPDEACNQDTFADAARSQEETLIREPASMKYQETRTKIFSLANGAYNQDSLTDAARSQETLVQEPASTKYQEKTLVNYLFEANQEEIGTHTSKKMTLPHPTATVQEEAVLIFNTCQYDTLHEGISSHQGETILPIATFKGGETLPYPPASARISPYHEDISERRAEANVQAVSIDQPSARSQSCKKCGMLYPNPNPSAILRKRHRRKCSNASASIASIHGDAPHHVTVVNDSSDCGDPHYRSTVVVGEVTRSTGNAESLETRLSDSVTSQETLSPAGSSDSLCTADAEITETLHSESFTSQETLFPTDTTENETLHSESFTSQETLFPTDTTENETISMSGSEIIEALLHSDSVTNHETFHSESFTSQETLFPTDTTENETISMSGAEIIEALLHSDSVTNQESPVDATASEIVMHFDIPVQTEATNQETVAPAYTTASEVLYSDTIIVQKEVFHPPPETPQDKPLFDQPAASDLLPFNQRGITNLGAICNKCGYIFTNRNPSPKVRRAHKGRCPMGLVGNEKIGES